MSRSELIKTKSGIAEDYCQESPYFVYEYLYSI